MLYSTVGVSHSRLGKQQPKQSTVCFWKPLNDWEKHSNFWEIFQPNKHKHTPTYIEQLGDVERNVWFWFYEALFTIPLWYFLASPSPSLKLHATPCHLLTPHTFHFISCLGQCSHCITILMSILLFILQELVKVKKKKDNRNKSAKAWSISKSISSFHTCHFHFYLSSPKT